MTQGKTKRIMVDGRTINLSTVDLGQAELGTPKVALIQAPAPEFNNDRQVEETNIIPFLDEDYRIRSDSVAKQEREISRLVERAIKEDGAQILCLPTIVVPEKMDDYFRCWCRKYGVIIISGFEFLEGENGAKRNVIRIYSPAKNNSVSMQNIRNCSVRTMIPSRWIWETRSIFMRIPVLVILPFLIASTIRTWPAWRPLMSSIRTSFLSYRTIRHSGFTRITVSPIRIAYLRICAS
jgi:hypothetical protein